MAVVSPMVSAAETRKIIQTERMAPILNCGVKGKSLGKDTKPSEKIRLKSTLPINMERIYNLLLATGIPQLDEKIANIENCNIVNSIQNKSELEMEIKSKNPHIVIVSDRLNGNENLIDLMSNLKRQNRYTRFIYLAGKLDIRDQNRINQLGKLVLSGIYDLCISENITIDLIKMQPLICSNCNFRWHFPLLFQGI